MRVGRYTALCRGQTRGVLALERSASLGKPSRAAITLRHLGDERRRCLGVFVTSGSVPPIRGVPAIGLARALGNMMILLLLFLQKQSLAFAVYLFGIGTLLTGLGSKKKHM